MITKVVLQRVAVAIIILGVYGGFASALKTTVPFFSSFKPAETLSVLDH
jgi:hypothetical protein